MGREDFIDTRFRNVHEENPILKDLDAIIPLYKKYRDIIDKEKPEPDDFTIYTEEERFTDFKEVRRLEGLFKQQDQKLTQENREIKERLDKLSVIAEGLLVDNISKSWFGDSVKAVPTCAFDDYINGIDLVLEFDSTLNPKTYTGLSVDVTFSVNEDVVYGKLQEIADGCVQGEMGKVKYFRSSYKDGETPEYMGALPKVPRAVVVMHPKFLAEMMEFDAKGKISNLEGHVFQVIMLQQLKFQYEQLIIIAKEGGHEEVEQAYTQSLAEVETIWNSEPVQKIVSMNPKTIREDRGLDIMESFFGNDNR